MSTTGVANFDLNFTEIAEEAFERAGRELRSGYDLRTARRSMNLLTIEWANRGINMWTIEPGTINLVQGQFCYPLPTDTIDLLEHQIRTYANSQSNQSDLTITRISVSTYATIPNKLTQARPIQVMIQRMSGKVNPVDSLLSASISSSATTISVDDVTSLPAFGFVKIDNEIINYSYISQTAGSTAGTLNNCFRGQANTTAASHTTGATVYWQQLPAVVVWPVPDQGATDNPYYQFTYFRMRRVQNAGDGIETGDMPFRFLPCLVAGLAYYVAMKIPEGGPRLEMLQAVYEQQFALAAGEDREKAPDRFVPRQYFIGG
jgi:hypothetical protein